jgi:hypothetical protein
MSFIEIHGNQSRKKIRINECSMKTDQRKKSKMIRNPVRPSGIDRSSFGVSFEVGLMNTKSQTECLSTIHVEPFSGTIHTLEIGPISKSSCYSFGAPWKLESTESSRDRPCANEHTLQEHVVNLRL